ncbi:hypothetical protein BOTBODRAFT_38795 [Botryobasidium botryosum FD-172 SS1]|uniref:Heat shock factor-binding protein 1 n=1 Tax=Botryobasidium botryosum (strain FD-172 SS1) TaxID=930990 RepID=A0A067M6J4_BOTB1|nr:hypothetical protein BOTBODRAFT_38795 [Botryobasidium botryosum FD-172 SS1]
MPSPLHVNASASHTSSKPTSPVTKSPPTAPSSATTATAPLASTKALRPEDISSPHELTAFVDVLLTQLETRFDEMSAQVLDRMNQMSTRVDALEFAIQDLINGDVAGPATPQTPSGATGLNRRTSEA